MIDYRRNDIVTEENIDPLIHQVLENRYRIDQEVGRGGMGIVYQGTDLTLSRPVAIKTILHRHANDEALNRFIREARTLAQIEDPRLVPVYAVGQDEGYHYLVMKFLEGETLAECMKREGSIDHNLLRDIVHQVCEALQVLHMKGLIHRDIKPANLMIAPDGQVTVMDLGIVKAIGEKNATSSIAMGTPRYMPPEAIDNHPLDARADLYSLGVIAFQAITGRVPFDGPTSMSILYKQAHEVAPLIRTITPHAPKNLESAIEVALQKSPSDRFQNAREMSKAFSTTARFVSTNTWRQTLIKSLIFLVLGGFGWSTWKHWRSSNQNAIQFNNTSTFLQKKPKQSDQKLQNQSIKNSKRSNFTTQNTTSNQKTSNTLNPKNPTPNANSTPSENRSNVNSSTQPLSPTSLKKIKVRLTSVPPRAKVYKNGKYVGKTPFVINKNINDPESYLIKLKGFKAKKVVVKNQNTRVKLKSVFGF